MFLNTILLQAQSNNWMNFIPLVGIAIVFYFFIFRPQQKKQKDQVIFKDSLKKGDKVVTIGGLHGKIAEMEGDTVILDVDRGTKLTFEKTSISSEATKRVQNTTTTSN